MDDRVEFATLVARLRAGDRAAAGELCRRYGQLLRAVVRRHLDPQLRTRFDSLDFVQDVWASVLAAPPGRYAFASHEDLAALLTRVARNKVYEQYRRFVARRGGAPREVPAGDLGAGFGEVPGTAASPSESAIAAERWERLRRNLPAGHQAILERLREGYSVDDIAATLGACPRTVRRVVERIRSLAEGS